MTVDTIIFDLDGTLVDSAPGILLSFSAVLAEQGITPCLPLDNSLVGPPLREAIARISGISESKYQDLLIESFMRHYDGEMYKASRPYPGIQEMLELLKSRGCSMHLATNKRLVPTQRILSCFGWTELFSSVYAIDKVTPRYIDKAGMLAALLKEQMVNAERAAYVGDRPEDRQAALRSGLPFVGVGWGYWDWSTPDSLERAWLLITDPSQLAGSLHLSSLMRGPSVESTCHP